MNRRKQIYIFFLAVGVLAAGSGIHESIFNNFLSDAHQLTAGKRGFLELPREAPGFLVVLMAGLLCMLPDTRIGLIGAATLAAGMFGMAMLGHAYSWMFAMMIVASAGMHLMMPINSSIAVALSDSESRGKRLGQLGAIQTAGMMIGSGLVYLFLGKTDPKYSLGFAAVGAAALVGAIVYGSMHVPDLHRRKPRLVLRRKFWSSLSARESKSSSPSAPGC